VKNFKFQISNFKLTFLIEILFFICLVFIYTPAVHAIPVISNIRFDDKITVTDDPIAAYPVIKAQVTGTSISINAFVLRIDGVQVTTIDPLNFSYIGTDFIYQVETRLTPGWHMFSLHALDSADGQRITVDVQRMMAMLEQDVIGDPLAIPNPATNNMRITYKLTQPGDIYISVYNLNADKVWEQELSRGAPGTSAGYNEISWNLRSGYGDYLPNGVYLCVISKRDDKNRVVMAKLKLFILR
jgi:hypothetical protein